MVGIGRTGTGQGQARILAQTCHALCTAGHHIQADEVAALGVRPVGDVAAGSQLLVEGRLDGIKAGHQTVCTIVGKLSDPDAIGDERVVVRDATFDKLTLMDWEAKKLTEDDYDFTFTDYDIQDMAEE